MELKHIQAYCRDEDQSESARNLLITYKAVDMQVSSIDQDGITNGGGNSDTVDLNNTVIPLLPTNVAGAAIAGAFGGIATPQLVFTDGSDRFRYVVYGKVESSKYDEVVNRLSELGVRIDK